MSTIKEGYTRVSDILKFFQDFSRIDEQVLIKKQIVGTNVHTAIKCFYNNAYYPTTEKEEGYFQSFVKWQEKSLVTPIEQEMRLYCNELRITGEIDMLAEFDGRLAIYDWKTSATKNEKVWSLQGAFYHYLAKVNKVNVSDFMFFIHLKKDGACAHVCDFMCTSELMQVCKSAVNVYRYFYDSSKELK